MSHHLGMLDDLRQAGLRLTPQREMILSVIRASDGHLTADDILKRVRARYAYLNKSAVYRTLDLLTRLNLVDPIDFGEGRIEYEIHQHPHHHHLLCWNCGKRMEIGDRFFVTLEKTLRAEYGFSADLDQFAIRGLCRKCQMQSKKSSRSAMR